MLVSNKFVGLNSCQVSCWRLFFYIIAAVLLCCPFRVGAHPSPNAIVLLDVTPDQVRMEVQMPVPELELAFKQNLSKDPFSILENWEKEIKTYLLEHINVYNTPDKLWQVQVEDLRLDSGLYADNVTAYWEVVGNVLLTPQEGGSTHDFYLAYDVIMHEVINHIALVSVRSDWENGNFGEDHTIEKATGTEAFVIARNHSDNSMPPLHVNLEKGSWWRGFKAMVRLGMHHISEGTDHLMFLLVLLLPAPLLVGRRQWAGFKGLKPTLYALLKIVTAFTIGHSITLLFGSLGWYRVPPRPIEILIAFSIFISALHAFRPLFPSRETYVAAGFGLIHGMAFATTIADLQLHAGAMALSIFGFNIGIEIMQLFIVLLIMPWLILMSITPYYKWFRIVMATLTSVAAIAWMVERWYDKGNVVTEQLDKVAGNGEWFIVGIAVLAIVLFISNRYFSSNPKPAKY